jgi:hypothetical protein
VDRVLRGLLPWTAVGLLFTSTLLAADEHDPGTFYRQALIDRGIATDRAALHEFLRQLHPEHPQQQKVSQLIEQLRATSFRTRRDAMTELSSTPEFAQVQLAAAEQHPDEEVRRRAASLRKKQRSEGDFVLFAALRCLKLQRDPQSVALILPLLPRMRDDYLHREAKSCLLASVTADNEAELLAALTSPEWKTREAALLALGRLDSIAGTRELDDALQLADDRLALAAAEGRAWHEPAAALPTLARLLMSENFQVRHRAASLLQIITRQQIGYAPYADPSQRTSAAVRWNRWVETDSQLTQLAALRDCPESCGRILLCLFRPFTVAEIDEAGNDTFRSTLTRAACGGETCLNTGHRYFADWERKSILVLDSYGQSVDEIPLPGIPNSLHLLSSGNMLTGIYNKNMVCEVSPSKEIVWEQHVDGQPSDARRLPNGNTLVALNNRHRVIEINPAGEVVWSLENVRTPESARRLENGNTLVASGREGRVCEYSPSGEAVWSLGDTPMAYDALLLENGHLLIAFQSGLREVDRHGNIIRELNLGVVRRIFRY